jgi:adenosylcobyric acid synthase
MLGRGVDDPAGVEGEPGARADGLGLLDVHTVFETDKVLRLPTGAALGAPASGYEIHHGRVSVVDGEEFLGGARVGSVFGTMWHGALEGDPLRRAWLAEAARLAGRAGFTPGEVSFAAARQVRIDALADAVEEHLDLDTILRLVTDGSPPGLPVLRGGLA